MRACVVTVRDSLASDHSCADEKPHLHHHLRQCDASLLTNELACLIMPYVILLPLFHRALHTTIPPLRGKLSSEIVLAQVGERVSIVCSPTERSVQSLQPGRFRPFGSGPPFTKPGQPLSATNHATGREHALQPPPSSASGIPGWVLPAAVLFSVSDAASGWLL